MAVVAALLDPARDDAGLGRCEQAIGFGERTLTVQALLRADQYDGTRAVVARPPARRAVQAAPGRLGGRSERSSA